MFYLFSSVFLSFYQLLPVPICFRSICRQYSLSFYQFSLVSFRFFYILLICHPRNIVLLYIGLNLASCILFLSFFSTQQLVFCPVLPLSPVPFPPFPFPPVSINKDKLDYFLNNLLPSYNQVRPRPATV